MPLPSTKDTALELVSNLIPIRPLRPYRKPPWVVDGKTLTLSRYEDVERFYTAHPVAGVGACLAPIDASPIVVVDIDICDVPELERPRVWEKIAELGVTTKAKVWAQMTGRQNYQVFYWWQPGDALPIRHVNAENLHVDLLANGYVVVAPSDTREEPPKKPGALGGGPYRWLRGKSPWDYSLAEVDPPPDRLLEWWRSLTTAHASAGGGVILPPDGEPITSSRNVTLTKLAGYLAKTFGPAEMAVRLRRVNQERCRPPLPAMEVETIIQSINHREDNSRAGDLGGSEDEIRLLR